MHAHMHIHTCTYTMYTYMHTYVHAYTMYTLFPIMTWFSRCLKYPSVFLCLRNSQCPLTALVLRPVDAPFPSHQVQCPLPCSSAPELCHLLRLWTADVRAHAYAAGGEEMGPYSISLQWDAMCRNRCCIWIFVNPLGTQL